MSDNPEQQQPQQPHHHGIEVLPFDEKKKKSLVSRVIVAIVLAVTGLPSLAFGGWVFFAFISFFLLVAIYEFIHARGKKYNWFVWVFTYFITLSYVYWAFAKSNLSASQEPGYVFSLEAGFREPMISWYAIIGSLGVYFALSIFDENFDLFDVVYLFAMGILVGLGFQCLLFLRYYPLAIAGFNQDDFFFRFFSSTYLFLFVMISAFGNDIMAYFVGVTIGRHKMSKRVSPNKSWEGFFGGWILGGLLTFGFACLVEGCGHPMLHNLLVFGPDSKWWAIFILSMTLPLIGDLGDLTLSLIKRYFGIKDYSHLLAAHGGVLDRVDSLMFCCIFASALLVIFEKGSSFFA